MARKGLCGFTELVKERLEKRLEGPGGLAQGSLCSQEGAALLLCLGKLAKGW